ncbi:hypothetical protein CI109_104371 [Kwoniella shandongensis]|uniref:beta-glucosidase n=1 Tax=Kwoniella shandongensis TaxID=1734106 RepID=A0A5M6C1E1_9TREE|nr:uncharacterized protein CI109_004231 [Kwoniella shandongensis]KAA5527415.1 hypothetical protein CI109_004231 [Kwoniella shandongensis]
MLLKTLLAATVLVLPHAHAQYVIPAADGSDGWADAFYKAKELVAQMTFEEKLNTTQQLQAPRVGAVPRLGYTGLYYADGSEGIRGLPFASAFDMALNGAASFDRGLLYRRAAAIGEEARGKGINVQFGPGVNLMRVPEAGRGFEYYGADPYLAGQAAEQHVKGVQANGVMALMRHYINNEQESGRHYTNVLVDDRTAHELYIWPFQDAVHAGVVSAMCAYNAINGVHACNNEQTLGKWLHEELNFQGFVMSDFGSIIINEEGRSANAGCDTVIGFTAYPFNDTQIFGQAPFGPNSALSRALANGTVPQSRLDDMATRIVASWYKLGQDQDYPLLETTANVLSKEHNELIRELGAKSTILLKNENNTLPLKNVKYLYVFGQAASVDLYGFPRPGGFSFGIDDDKGTFPGGQGSSYANLPYLITPFEALQSRARKDQSQVFGYFDNFNHTRQATYAAAADALNATCLVDVRNQCSEGYDRANLTASWEGDQTILAVASRCADTVVIYSACGPFNVTSWVDHPNITAILNPGGGGQEAGNSLVDILYGEVNPSARLPYTIGYQLADYPAVADTTLRPPNTSYADIDYSEGLYIDYRWFDKNEIEPAFEFGFGLSYTTFSYSDLSVQPSTASLYADEKPSSQALYDCLALVTISITNSGEVDGTEIPQLYLGSPAADSPVKVLRGFESVYLKKGESNTVTYQLTRRDLSYWNTQIEGWTLPTGEFQVYVGASSRDIRASGKMSFQLQ